jgi:hypothetical protein
VHHVLQHLQDPEEEKASGIASLEGRSRLQEIAKVLYRWHFKAERLFVHAVIQRRNKRSSERSRKGYRTKVRSDGGWGWVDG